MDNKRISKLYYYYNGASAWGPDDLVVYMGHTSKTEFGSTSDWVAIGDLTEVYNGHFSVPAVEGWVEIVLDNPFIYNNTDNLIIAADENTNGSHNSGDFYCTSAATGRGLSVSDDIDNPDPADPPPSLAIQDAYPNVRLQFEDILDMALVSSRVTQKDTAIVTAGSTDRRIIGVEVVTSRAGLSNPISVTSFDFNLTTGDPGSAAAADIDSAKVYCTGVDPLFSTPTLFGAIEITGATSAFTVSGDKQLATEDTTFFWLTYDIADFATEFNVVDAQCTSFDTTRTGTGAAISTPTECVGSRTIRNALSGTYTIDADIATGGTNYQSFSDAINDLNYLGVKATGNGVTFHVDAGDNFTELPPPITATGTAVDSIIFRKDGTEANPVINATGMTGDAVVELRGGDYFIFDGIDAVQTDGAVTRGFYIHAASATNGCQHNRLINCTVTLAGDGSALYGVYLNFSATEPAGANSHNQFYDNTVQHASHGYYMVGNSESYDIGNEIGSLSGGGSSRICNLTGNDQDVYGVYFANQSELKVFNTAITNLTGDEDVYGVYTDTGNDNIFDIYSCDMDTLISSSSDVAGVYLISYESVGFAVVGNVYDNEIQGLRGASSAYGIYTRFTANFSDTTRRVNHFYRNKIHDLESLNAYGIYYSGYSLYRTKNIHNNMTP